MRGRKGHYKELFEQVRKKGYLYVRVDGEVREALPGMSWTATRTTMWR